MRQRVWLSEACAAGGETSGEQNAQPTQRLVKLENSAQVKESIPMNANTTQEIQRQLYSLFRIDSEYIGMHFFTSPEGVIQRKLVEGEIDPTVFMLYVKLYLKKHPPLS